MSWLVHLRRPSTNRFKAPIAGTTEHPLSSIGLEMLAYDENAYSHENIPTMKSGTATLTTQPSLTRNFFITG
jgi:hypothetical protein